MTPEELNKAIAELKGEVPVYDCNVKVGEPCPDGFEGGGPEICEDCPRLLPQYKPYSADIRYAMELWNEMKADKSRSINLHAGEHGVSCTLNGSNELSKYFKSVFNICYNLADTEAQAIAECWLKWKKGE